MPGAPNQRTLNFYRRLLHSMMKTFVRDVEMFHKVRLEARRKILENKDETDDVKIQDMIFFGEEVREFLNNNLIQAPTLLFSSSPLGQPPAQRGVQVQGAQGARTERGSQAHARGQRQKSMTRPRT